MAKDPWLPKGYALPDDAKIRAVMYSGERWQLFDTTSAEQLLLAKSELTQRWTDSGLLDECVFRELCFGPESFRFLTSPRKYALTPVENATPPASKIDALAFAVALKESRQLSADASFHDAIYVEQYSRLLPTWTLTPHVDDEVVLGTWLTGGVVISTDSFRRLAHLTGWMPGDDVAEIVRAAGFGVPADANLLARRKSASHSESDAMRPSTTAARKPEDRQSPREALDDKTFSLPGRPKLEAFFNDHVIDIIVNNERYQVLGIGFPSAIILHGPPGCGKTFAVEQLVDFLDWPSYSIDSNSVGSPYIHETNKRISEVFDKAMDNAPSVVIIDEMESFLSDRRAGGSSGLHHVEEVAEFLRRIPEATGNKVLIVAMTNMIDMIDPAILRRGRFDHVIEVGMPSRDEVAALVDSLLSRLPQSDDLNLDKILNALSGRPLSDSAFLIREAARLAAKAGKTELDQASTEAALASLPKPQGQQSRPIGFVRDDE